MQVSILKKNSSFDTKCIVCIMDFCSNAVCHILFCKTYHPCHTLHQYILYDSVFCMKNRCQKSLKIRELTPQKILCRVSAKYAKNMHQIYQIKEKEPFIKGSYMFSYAVTSFTITSTIFFISSMEQNSSTPWKFWPPVQRFGVGIPM